MILDDRHVSIIIRFRWGHRQVVNFELMCLSLLAVDVDLLAAFLATLELRLWRQVSDKVKKTVLQRYKP